MASQPMDGGLLGNVTMVRECPNPKCDFDAHTANAQYCSRCGSTLIERPVERDDSPASGARPVKAGRRRKRDFDSTVILLIALMPMVVGLLLGVLVDRALGGTGVIGGLGGAMVGFCFLFIIGGQ